MSTNFIFFYSAMILLFRLCEKSVIEHELYVTLILDKGCGDALNVCRVSPRVGVVTVIETSQLIG